MTLEERVMEHEGFVPIIYKDTRGFGRMMPSKRPRTKIYV